MKSVEKNYHYLDFALQFDDAAGFFDSRGDVTPIWNSVNCSLK